MLGICRAFHVLPSAVLAEDAELLQLLAIEARGTPDPHDAGGPDWGGWDG